MTLSSKLERFSAYPDVSDQIFSNALYPSAAFPETSQPLDHQIRVSQLANTSDEAHALVTSEAHAVVENATKIKLPAITRIQIIASLLKSHPDIQV